MVVNLSAINVSDETFLGKLYMEPFGKNYQADTDALNKNVVQYRGECEWNVSEINITKVVSTKWYHLGITAIFFAKAKIYLKGVLIKFHSVLFRGWGVRLDFP